MPNSIQSVARRISDALEVLTDDPTPAIRPFLNGHAAHSIDRMLTRARRRKDGIFFSGEAWSQRLLSCVADPEIMRWCDPAAGTGDLLLEAARRLPLQTTLGRTLQSWSNRLIAGEKSAAFLAVAWQRIRALAVLRHFERDGQLTVSKSAITPSSFFAGDTLSNPVGVRATDCLIMNPPYTHRESPPWCQTSSGRVSTAALFVERYVTCSRPGTRIVALVPDVLRSGTRYRKLRRFLDQRVDIELFAPQGAFSADADVDVSLLVCRVGAVAALSQPLPTERVTVSDLFQVRVGNVVPHRTPSDGPAKRYLVARGLPDGGILTNPVSRANFNAPTYRAPFVVIRRTSSPSDRIRTRATLVRDGDFLVENHLIVCSPRPGVAADCERLLRVFADPRTNDWMNERIRCRHLTTAAVNELPVWD